MFQQLFLSHPRTVKVLMLYSLTLGTPFVVSAATEGSLSSAVSGVSENHKTSDKPQVRSFDCFDTLVGRLHQDPRSIFFAMEEAIPCPGFASLRVQAEATAREKTLKGIYEELQRKLGLSDQRRDALRSMEFEEELRNVFPICRNMSLVKDGDLVVTDTYYTEQEIRKILQTVGLKKQVHIVATYGGKYSRQVWSPLLDQYQIEYHLGDNKESDVASAESYGIPAKWFSAGEFSPIEKCMLDANHVALARFMRALRLQNPYPADSEAFLVWNEQAELNFPILLLSSHYLDALCKAEGYTTILFSQRGCCHWMPVFQALFPAYRSVSFPSSRVVYRKPSPEYVKYVRLLNGPNVVLVDEQGSGKTVKEFFEKEFSKVPPALYIASTNEAVPGITFSRGDHFECLNEDRVGTLMGFDAAGPVRAPLEYDVARVTPAFQCVDLGISLLSKYCFQPYDEKAMSTLMDCLYSYRPVFKKYHVADH